LNTIRSVTLISCQIVPRTYIKLMGVFRFLSPLAFSTCRNIVLWWTT